MPRSAGVRADYDRVVKQRNALLRTAYLTRKVGGTRGQDLSTLAVWDTHLAKHGAELLAGRLELVAALGPHLTKGTTRSPPDGAPAAIAYQSRLGDDLVSDRPALEAAILARLAERRIAEVERGMTLVGPHRDDLALSLGDLPAKGYASHGESWSIALALRLAAYDLLRTDGIEPVLILDDVFAELDTGRRDRLAGLVSDATQLLVTCAVPEDVPAALQGARYDVGGRAGYAVPADPAASAPPPAGTPPPAKAAKAPRASRARTPKAASAGSSAPGGTSRAAGGPADVPGAVELPEGAGPELARAVLDAAKARREANRPSRRRITTPDGSYVDGVGADGKTRRRLRGYSGPGPGPARPAAVRRRPGTDHEGFVAGRSRPLRPPSSAPGRRWSARTSPSTAGRSNSRTAS